MINGRRSEAQKGFAVLEDVDVGTFTRFSRWAYNGYYSPAAYSMTSEDRTASLVCDILEEGVEKPEQREVPRETPPQPSLAPFSYSTIPTVLYDPPTAEPTDDIVKVIEVSQPERELDEDWGGFSRLSKKKKGKKGIPIFGGPAVEEPTASPVFRQQRSPKVTLKESFIELKFAVLEIHPLSLPPRSNRDSCEDYTEVFLSHARLYVFAEKYEIQPLKVMAIQQLHQTLAIYTLYPERVGDIVELLRYVYANTAEADDGTEELRAMLVHYVGYEMDILVKAPEFKELLLEEGGALLSDFMGMVEKRIKT